MIETFVALLFAHVLADFVFQTDWLVANKRKPHVLLLHAVIVLVTLQLALGSVTAWPLLALAAAHLVIDAIKIFAPKNSGIWPFMIDQAAHMGTLIATAVLFPALWADGQWGDLIWLPALMAALSGLVICVRAGGFIIGLLMVPWADTDLPEGLEQGGHLIGLLERAMIFLLVMVGQPAGVGFLIAAKSLLRFDKDRRASEYVIIGTLASFGWALFSAYATLALLAQLPPLGILPQTP